MRFLENIYKAVLNPPKAYSFLRMLWRTLRYRMYYSLFFRNRITLGSKLKIFGKLSIKGPGKVFIGNNVNISMRVTLWTYDQDAVITIGDNVFLNGTRFGCKKSITIGTDCIIGESRILDTNFHSIYINRHDNKAPVKTDKVIIGKNVWIPPECQVLPGVTIGDNSVIGVNSVVSSSIPVNSLATGNPAIVRKTLQVYTIRQNPYKVVS